MEVDSEIIQKRLRNLLRAGIDALGSSDIQALEQRAEEYIAALKEVREHGLGDVVEGVLEEFRLRLKSEAESTALEEFQETVRFLSIEDPFERWAELSRVIGRDWPENLTAEEAVRRQRR